MCPQSWNLSTASPLNPLESHPYPHPVHRGKQRPEQSSWAWGGQRPQVRGLRALASVLFLERPGQIRTGVRARLSWERTLWKAPDPFHSQMLDPRAGSGRAKGMTGDRQGPSRWAVELQGDRGRFRLTDAWKCAATPPKPAQGPPSVGAWSRDKGKIPSPQLSAKSRFETLGSRKPHYILEPGLTVRDCV